MTRRSHPDCRATLDKARDAGLALAARVSDAPGYAAAFQRFGALMNDGHATAFADLPADLVPTTNWPGFVAVWRGDGLFVLASKVDAIPKGAKILGCDGVGIRTLIRRNVFDWYGREKIDGLWWSRARRVFYDDGNRFITRPNTCTFAASGRRVRHTLEWRDGDAEFDAWRASSYNGDELPIGRTEPRPGLVWIAMPSFGPDAAGVAAYRSLVQSLKETRPEPMRARAIVLDLRQNQGGSSQWSREIAGALWGDARVDRRLNALFARVEIWFRANDATARHVETLATRFENEGSPEDARDARAVVASIHPGRYGRRPSPGAHPRD